MAKYWSFSFSNTPSNEHSGLISFRIDRLNLPAVQGVSQKSSPTPQFKSINSSALSLITTGKTTALTIQTFISKVMSLLFNMLSRFVIAFLPRSKHLLISWPQSPSTVTLEPKKIKSVTVSIFSPSIRHEVMGPDAMILAFWILNFKSAFHSPLSLSSKGSLIPLHFLP